MFAYLDARQTTYQEGPIYRLPVAINWNLCGTIAASAKTPQLPPRAPPQQDEGLLEATKKKKQKETLNVQ